MLRRTLMLCRTPNGNPGRPGARKYGNSPIEYHARNLRSGSLRQPIALSRASTPDGPV
jgi:hypothetical protein